MDDCHFLVALELCWTKNYNCKNQLKKTTFPLLSIWLYHKVGEKILSNVVGPFVSVNSTFFGVFFSPSHLTNCVNKENVFFKKWKSKFIMT